MLYGIELLLCFQQAGVAVLLIYDVGEDRRRRS